MSLRTSACVLAACLTVASIAGVAEAAQRTDLRGALEQIYEPSTIEVQSKAVEGRVGRRGALLRLEADGITAKPFRVTQANTKSPRFHVNDYARVELTSDRFATLEPGELQLPKGTEVVVLDIKVEAGAVRLLTHTSQPILRTGGRTDYGCTEFVLPMAPSTMAAADVGRMRESIERWLSPRV
jgi:hypothetical protein